MTKLIKKSTAHAVKAGEIHYDHVLESYMHIIHQIMFVFDNSEGTKLQAQHSTIWMDIRKDSQQEQIHYIKSTLKKKIQRSHLHANV